MLALVPTEPSHAYQPPVLTAQETAILEIQSGAGLSSLDSWLSGIARASTKPLLFWVYFTEMVYDTVIDWCEKKHSPIAIVLQLRALTAEYGIA